VLWATERTRQVRGAGIELKFVEPPEARKPNRKWRLYIFKAGEKDAIKGECVEEHCGTALHCVVHCAKANGGGIAQRSRMSARRKHRLGSPR
jgi:hypothetical protein